MTGVDDPGRTVGVGDAEFVNPEVISPEALAISEADSDGGAAESNREEAVMERIERWRRHRPRLKDELINSAHGAGGKASAALVDAVFVEAFRNETLETMADGAVLGLPSGERIAFSTDSYVVKPRRFPGGSIGHLAIHGTVNDLSMMGAAPSWISAAFIIEDGFSIAELRGIVADMADAAREAGVIVVTGDTKVVDRGACDGVYITTAGVGLIPPGVNLDARHIRPGDKVLVSGRIGDHGVAVLIARGDLALEAPIESDTAPLNELVEHLLAAAPGTRFLRDATRGGVATVCNEMARDAEVGVTLHEATLPVRNMVNGACEILGIDPLYVANEGKLVAVVPAEEANAALAAMQAHRLGVDAAIIGDITPEPPGIVVLRTALGGSRIVDMLVGDPLPRIC